MHRCLRRVWSYKSDRTSEINNTYRFTWVCVEHFKSKWNKFWFTTGFTTCPKPLAHCSVRFFFLNKVICTKLKHTLACNFVGFFFFLLLLEKQGSRHFSDVLQIAKNFYFFFFLSINICFSKAAVEKKTLTVSWMSGRERQHLAQHVAFRCAWWGWQELAHSCDFIKESRGRSLRSS